MASSIEDIFMVEASKELQTAQKTLLCGDKSQSTDSDSGFRSLSKYGGKPITWTDSIKSIPISASYCCRIDPYDHQLTDTRPQQDAFHRGSRVL